MYFWWRKGTHKHTTGWYGILQAKIEWRREEKKSWHNRKELCDERTSEQEADICLHHQSVWPFGWIFQLMTNTFECHFKSLPLYLCTTMISVSKNMISKMVLLLLLLLVLCAMYSSTIPFRRIMSLHHKLCIVAKLFHSHG